MIPGLFHMSTDNILLWGENPNPTLRQVAQGQAKGSAAQRVAYPN